MIHIALFTCCALQAGPGVPPQNEPPRIETQVFSEPSAHCEPAPDLASRAERGKMVRSDVAATESTPVVQAMGIGRPPRRVSGTRARSMARRAAEVVAVRNLATKLGYGRQARIRGFRYVSTEYLLDGSVRVTVEYPGRARPPKRETPPRDDHRPNSTGDRSSRSEPVRR